MYYADGRSMCEKCVERGPVTTVAEAQALFERVLAFFEALGVRMPGCLSAPPVALLDSNSVQAICQRSGSIHAVQRCPVGITCCRHLVLSDPKRRVASAKTASGGATAAG